MFEIKLLENRNWVMFSGLVAVELKSHGQNELCLGVAAGLTRINLYRCMNLILKTLGGAASANSMVIENELH